MAYAKHTLFAAVWPCLGKHARIYEEPLFPTFPWIPLGSAAQADGFKEHSTLVSTAGKNVAQVVKYAISAACEQASRQQLQSPSTRAAHQVYTGTGPACMHGASIFFRQRSSKQHRTIAKPWKATAREGQRLRDCLNL